MSNAFELPLPLAATSTESEPLRRRIVARIRKQGPLPFSEFMRLALFDASEGYYRSRQAIGQRGDYLTSPEIHPLFGGLIARQVLQCWHLLDRPATFRLIEPGPGNGTLARGLLSALSGTACGDATQAILVEPSESMRVAQAATLGDAGRAVSWVRGLDELAGETATSATRAPTVLVSNEVVDSFPFHRVSVREGVLHELFVDLDGDEFVDRVGPVSTAELPAYFERLQLLPGEGCSAEVNLEAATWMSSVARTVRTGFVLTLDYGYEAARLFAPWRRDGTLLCFYRHGVSIDPYRRIGRQDITAHVDFTSLAAAGEAAGLLTLGITSQREFLAALGAGDILRGGPDAAPNLEEYLSRRRALEALLDGQGLGRIRVLAQCAGVDQAVLAGFVSGAA